MKHKGAPAAVFSILILLAGCLSCAPKDIEVVRVTEMMSTAVRLTLTGTDEGKLGGLAEEAFAYMRELSSRFNIYDPASEVSLLNGGEAGKPVRVSPEMAEVLGAAAAANRHTDGFFDITVRPLVLLWKDSMKTGVLPTEDQIRKARSLAGFSSIILSGDTVTILKPGISMDLGGIAKGYIVHKGAEYLKQRGVKAGIVDAGGDLYAWGKKPNGQKWRIGIQHPREKGTMLKTMEIEDKAVLTSGDYERFFIRDGKRYSHIVNPFTGVPDSDVVSVTVVSPNLMAVDGLSSGLVAMGSARALKKIDQLRKAIPGTDIFIVWMEGDSLKSSGTIP